MASSKPPENWVRITCDDRQHVVEFTSRDWKVLFHLARKTGADIMASLGFDASKPRQTSRSMLLSAARKALDLVASELPLIEYDYSFDIPAHGALPRMRGTGAVGGLRINCEPHCLSAQPGQCWLERWEITSSGKGQLAEVRDLRGQTSLELDGGIVVRLSRRRRPVSWTEALPPMIAFLDSCPSESVLLENRHRR